MVFLLLTFGTKVWYKDEAQSDPPPSKLNLGIGFVPVENNFYSLQTQLAISKPFDRAPIENGAIPNPNLLLKLYLLIGKISLTMQHFIPELHSIGSH